MHLIFRTALVLSLLAPVMACGEATEPATTERPDATTSAEQNAPNEDSDQAVAAISNPEAQQRAEANITDQPRPAGSAEWLPPGEWTLEWADEFLGPAGDETNPNVKHWYPMLGWTPTDFKTKTEKGLRWNGKTAESSQFYSTKTGNHWLTGDGTLLLRASVDKTQPPNDNGPRVNTAYLQTGYPAGWEKRPPAPGAEPKSIVKWEPGDGVFVSPTVDGQVQPLYIAARLRADQVHGWSTWFAFWVFSHTDSYNNHPADGTEIDVMEVVAGNNEHFKNFFNVANHWYPAGKVKEDRYFNEHTTPKASEFVDLTDGNYHTWGLEWSDQFMKCYVDGKLYYTFTDHIPVEPRDMMLMLTLEFQQNLWIGNTGDGRVEGPHVSDNQALREISRVLVDYVRIYRQQAP